MKFHTPGIEKITENILMSKKVLVTGISGFIGQNIIEGLKSSGYEIYAVRRNEKSTVAHEGITWVTGNLLELGVPTKIIDGVKPTHLLHLAWYTEHQKFWRAPESMHWVRASLELVQAFQASGGVRSVFAGSCAEYDWGYGYMTENQTPCKPHTPFGATKLSLYDSIKAYSEITGMSYAWGRVFFAYGPNENPLRLVTGVMTKIINDQCAETSSGTQIRDFMHVKDIADSFVALLESDLQGAINIASGEANTVKRILEIIGSVTGRSELIKLGAMESRLMEPPCILANVSRLKDQLRFKPTYDIQSGIEHLYDVMKKLARK